jgi:hypothetical protein
LTALDVSHRLRGMIVSVAGGRDEAIRTLAGSNTVAGLAATMISLPSGGEVRLDDLGIVTDTVAERSTFARFNGDEPIVAVAVTCAKGASDVVVGKQVQARIDQFKAADANVDLKLIDVEAYRLAGVFQGPRAAFVLNASRHGEHHEGHARADRLVLGRDRRRRDRRWRGHGLDQAVSHQRF